MKVLAIQGSPRKKGNTALLLDQYLQGLQSNDVKIEIDLIKLGKMDIRPCKGCGSCREHLGKCTLKDDMQEIYPLLLAADVIILASPVYWWNITAQAKQFLDRFYALNYGENFRGKKFVLLMTYADKDPNSGLEITKSMFREICDYLGMDFAQSFGVCTGETGFKDNAQAQAEATDLGKWLVP